MLQRLTKLALVLCLGLSAGCGETNREAILRLAPRYESKRQQLWRLAASLPEIGSVKQPWFSGAMVPPLEFDEPRGRANTEILMVEQLRDPDVELDDVQQFDALLSSRLLACLRWTGPRNPIDPSLLDRRGSLGAVCEAAFAHPYLVVLRTTEFTLPEVLSLEGLVIDMRVERLIATFAVTLRTRFSEDDLGRGPWAMEARRLAHSAFLVQARCRVAAALAELPGARVALDGPCKPDPLFGP